MCFGKGAVIFTSPLQIEAEQLLRAINEAEVERKGRGHVQVVLVGGKRLFVRKYIHGGLLRGVLRDLFFSEERGKREMEMFRYAKEKGLPVPSALCLLVQKVLMLRRIFIVQEYIEDSEDLVDYLKRVKGLERARVIRRVGLVLSKLHSEGILLRDLHLRNILVGRDGKVWLVDFDRAERKRVSREDVKKVLLRLERYVEKLERRGSPILGDAEKVLFIRSFEKFSGLSIVNEVRRNRTCRRISYRLGWFLDQIIYGGQR